MKRRTSYSALIVTLPLIWAVPPASAQEAVVQCYDTARELLQARLAADCTGKVVSEAEAAKIRAALRRARLKRAMRPRSEREQGPRGHGTGFFITDDGLIVTNNHVTEKCKQIIWIDTTDGQQGTAEIVDADKKNDLALLQSNLAAPAVAVFRNPVLIGANDPVAVIGYGTIKLPPLRPHLTKGAYQGASPNGARFQMKAAVRPGNSGGPVLDAAGFVIGVVFAQLNTVKTYKKRGKLILDRGFAISNPIVFRFLERNKVAFRRAPGPADNSAAPPPERLFAQSKPFIARVSCRR